MAESVPVKQTECVACLTLHDPYNTCVSILAWAVVEAALEWASIRHQGYRKPIEEDDLLYDAVQKLCAHPLLSTWRLSAKEPTNATNCKDDCHYLEERDQP